MDIPGSSFDLKIFGQEPRCGTANQRWVCPARRGETREMTSRNLFAIAAFPLIVIGAHQSAAQPLDAGIPPLPTAELVTHGYAFAQSQAVKEMFAPTPACGASCMYFLLRLHDIDVSLEQMADEIPVTGQGASLLDLKNAAEQNGMPVEVLEVTPDELARLELPLIALMGTDPEKTPGHYIVLSKVTEEGVMGIDGTTTGRISFTATAFNKEFSGFVLSPQRTTDWLGIFRLVVIGVCIIESCLLAYFLSCWLYRSRIASRT